VENDVVRRSTDEYAAVYPFTEQARANRETVEGEPTAGDDVAADLTTFERDDGATRVAANGRPLYYSAGDEKPCEANGQVLDDVRWVLGPAGTPSPGGWTPTPTAADGGAGTDRPATPPGGRTPRTDTSNDRPKMTPMNRIVRVLGGLVQSVVTFVVLIVLAILAFYVTVFVVSTGAGLAGYDPSGDFVVLSAALLVVAALLGGIPIGRAHQQEYQDSEPGAGFE
jgi:hypothetical protein